MDADGPHVTPATSDAGPSGRAIGLRRIVPLAVAIPVGLLVVLALVGGAVFVVEAQRSSVRDGPGTRSVALMVDGQAPVQGWSYASGTAGLVSTPQRSTYLDVALRRDEAAAAQPVLQSDFDGSGGGEPKIVRCAIPPGTRWSVAVGRTQHLRLPCGRFVPEWQLRSIRSVYIGDDLG